MTRILQLFLVLLAAFLFAGCAADPMWEREGGCLNPWGGDFLEIKSTWQRVKAKRQWAQFQREWGVPECFHGDPHRYYYP